MLYITCIIVVAHFEEELSLCESPEGGECRTKHMQATSDPALSNYFRRGAEEVVSFVSSIDALLLSYKI